MRGRRYPQARGRPQATHASGPPRRPGRDVAPQRGGSAWAPLRFSRARSRGPPAPALQGVGRWTSTPESGSRSRGAGAAATASWCPCRTSAARERRCATRRGSLHPPRLRLQPEGPQRRGVHRRANHGRVGRAPATPTPGADTRAGPRRRQAGPLTVSHASQRRRARSRRSSRTRRCRRRSRYARAAAARAPEEAREASHRRQPERRRAWQRLVTRLAPAVPAGAARTAAVARARPRSLRSPGPPPGRPRSRCCGAGSPARTFHSRRASRS